MAHETIRLAEYAAALRYEDLPAPVALGPVSYTHLTLPTN